MNIDKYFVLVEGIYIYSLFGEKVLNSNTTVFKTIISITELSTLSISFTVYLLKYLKLIQNTFLNLKTESPIP